MPNVSAQDVKKAFAALELAPTADKKQIKKKSLALLMKSHTDRTGLDATAESEQKTRDINEAREILLTTLSDSELSDFVSELNRSTSTSTATPISNPAREQSLGNSITIPSVIQIINRPERKIITVETVFPAAESSFIGELWSGLFGSSIPPVEPEQEPRTLSALCLGNIDSGKSVFFNTAFKTYESVADFKLLRLNKVTYTWHCMADQERFRKLTQAYYDRANIMAFFGDDYASIRRWISTTQQRLTQDQQQEEQPQLYYVSYVNDTLNLQPWGDITEDEFNRNQTQQKIPAERIHQFMTQFYNKVNDIILSPIPQSNRARIQGGPGSS